VIRNFGCLALEADTSDMGLEEVLTSVKKVPKSSRKRQNSQSTGRKGGQRVNESLRDDPLDMLHTSWFDEKLNGDEDVQRTADRKSTEKPKSRKKSETKAVSNGKTSRRSRAESEDMLQYGYAPPDEIRPNGSMASRAELGSDSKRRREARSSYEPLWNQDFFATRSELYRMDQLLSQGVGFEPEPGTSGDMRQSAAVDRQVSEEKGGRTRHRRRSDVKTDAMKLGSVVGVTDALMANITLDTGNAAATLPNHKVCCRLLLTAGFRDRKQLIMFSC